MVGDGAPGGRQDLAGWVRGRGDRRAHLGENAGAFAPQGIAHISTDRDRSSGVSESTALQQKPQSSGRLRPVRQAVSVGVVPLPGDSLARQQPLQYQAYVVGPQFSRGKDSPPGVRAPGPPRSGDAPRRADFQVLVPTGSHGCRQQSWGFGMSRGTGQHSPAWSPPRPVHVGIGIHCFRLETREGGRLPRKLPRSSSSSGNGQLFPARAFPVAGRGSAL